MLRTRPEGLSSPQALGHDADVLDTRAPARLRPGISDRPDALPSPVIASLGRRVADYRPRSHRLRLSAST